MSRTVKRLVVVVGGWPRLSETFIAQELLGLETRGLSLQIVALKHAGIAVHDLHKRMNASVFYLPERLHRQPLRVWCSFNYVIRLPGCYKALTLLFHKLLRMPKRDLWRTFRRFGQACILAAEIKPQKHLYAHYLHKPSDVVHYTALFHNISWSFSAHAIDIWKTSLWDKQQKLRHAQWGITCSKYALRYLQSLTPNPERLELIYHGLDFSRFPSTRKRYNGCDGSSPQEPVLLLSVCRLVEKKGLDILLDALGLLPPDLSWCWRHVGGVSTIQRARRECRFLSRLKKKAQHLGLCDRITWLGARSQEEIFQEYQRTDIFILPCRRAKDGDQDGLPNVLIEAQFIGVPCISTYLSAIPEVIVDKETGLLVESENPQTLADAIQTLINDPVQRQKLGTKAHQHIKQHFSCHPYLDRLAEKLKEALS